jgi:hypothetical protein
VMVGGVEDLGRVMAVGVEGTVTAVGDTGDVGEVGDALAVV